MNDRELLELAAKAVGIDLKHCPDDNAEYIFLSGGRFVAWNPLTNDGDALQLAVKLGLLGAPVHIIDFIEAMGSNDPYTATRHAIVHAAAEIGKTKN